MPVCLHCGELGPDGALFCAKCGYTLPQPGSEAAPTPRTAPSPPTPPPVRPGPPPGVVLPPTGLAPGAGGSYIASVTVVPGAVPPIPPPPAAKYCTRCATPISIAAVYCPVCQQPQG